MFALTTFSFLLLLLLAYCHAGEFNDQVMGRVAERLSDYMGVPIDATHRTRNFRHLQGFPNDLEAADRNVAMTHLYSEVNVRVYFGLEDGTFVIYSDTPADPYVSYRSPGDSGFDVSLTVPPDMQKHYEMCVNRDTGESEECIMAEGSPYVHCESSETTTGSTTETDCRTRLAPCASQTDNNQTTKWCPQYEIRNVESGETRGFVPRLYSCINPLGQAEQTQGRVLLDEGTQELGNCYFRDGATLVDRNISGAFAFCGMNDEGTQPAVCDDAFLGVYRSRDYDPRYRGWYRSCKEKQTVIWSDPYPFFSTLAVGMTLNRPIYSIQQGKTVFQGVLAVDYSLEQISTFLADQYKGTDINVLIVEDSEPNYVVAASTGTPGATLVLKDNETLPCNVQENQDQFCSVVRVPIDELTGGEADDVLVAAFQAQTAAGWPRNELVSVKTSNIPGSEAYASQSELFEQENANLRWRVIVTMPIERATDDAALRGDNVFAIVCLLGGLGFFVCFVLFLVFFGKRHDQAVIHADWRFTCAFILGCATINLSTFTLLGENSDGLCMLRMWAFNALFACAISPLFVKVYRMYRLFKASVGFRRVSVNHFQALLMTLPIIVAELILLSIFSIVDPPRQMEALDIEGGLASQHLFCDQGTRAFFILQVLFDGVLVLIGCILAVLTRDLDPKFGEAKQLAFAMYNIAFTGIIIVTILQVVDMDRSGKLILQAIGILWGSLFSAFAFVLPRLIEVVANENASKKKQWAQDEASGDIMKVSVDSKNGARWTGVSAGVSSFTRRDPATATGKGLESVAEHAGSESNEVESSCNEQDDAERNNGNAL